MEGLLCLQVDRRSLFVLVHVIRGSLLVGHAVDPRTTRSTRNTRKPLEVEGRSELDSTGKPFPLLHMRISKTQDSSC